MMTIGEHIKCFRADRGWSMEEMARRMPIGIASISYWERGLRLPTSETATRVALLLGVDPAEVLPIYRSKSDYHKRRTHCRRGHELSHDNVAYNKRGNRQCITCRRERSKIFYEVHKEEIKAWSKEYQKTDAQRERRRIYFEKNHARIIDKNRKYYNLNKDSNEYKARRRAYYVKNKSTIVARMKERRRNDPELRKKLYAQKRRRDKANVANVNAACRRRRKAKPEVYRALQRRHYLKKRDTILDASKRYRKENRTMLLVRDKVERDQAGPCYVKQLLRNIGIPSEVSAKYPELIEVKKAELKLKRAAYAAKKNQKSA